VADTDDDPMTPRLTFVVCAVAVLAGIVVGFIGGWFRRLLDTAVELRAAVVDVAHGISGVGWLIPVAVTAVAAGLAALIVRFVPLAGGSGIQHVEAVYRGQSAPPPVEVVPARFLGGLLSIGSGLVLGREGPTVHMAAAIGHAASRVARLTDVDGRMIQPRCPVPGWQLRSMHPSVARCSSSRRSPRPFDCGW
jgi:CIC family chloride channel protein